MGKRNCLIVYLLGISCFHSQASIIPPAPSLQSVAITNAINAPSHHQIVNDTSFASSANHGELIWQYGGNSVRMADASASASAKTSVGVNKVAIRATETTPIRPANVLDYSGWENNKSAWATAYANSLWKDWFIIGGTAGRGLQVTARGYVEFSSLFGVIDNKTVPWDASFFAGGQSAYQWSARSFGTVTAPPSILRWEHTFNVTSGQWFEFGTSLALWAGAAGGFLSHMDWSTQFRRTIMADINSMHTSVLTGFEVSDGSEMKNSVDNLLFIDGKYTYQTSVDEGLEPGDPMRVSEPPTWLLVASLLCVFLLRRRQFKR